MANEGHFCMCITPDNVSAETRATLAGRKAALLRDYQWPMASVITVRFLGGDPALQLRVREAARLWTAPGLANLTLNFIPDGQAMVRVTFQQGDGSWSYVGTYCQTIPQSQPTTNFGWLTPSSLDEDVRSVVLHEFGHVLGLIHEHQNPERPIQWNEAAVIRDLSGPPNNWDIDTIRRNVLDRYDPSKVAATPVDPESIMMYPIPASWTNGTFSSGFNTKLTEQDKNFIRQCYP